MTEKIKYSKSYDRKTGNTYVYQILENKWNPELKRGETVRKCIGKWDPVTETIIPNRKRGRPKKETAPSDPEKPAVSSEVVDYKSMYQELLQKHHEKEQELQSLKKQLSQKDQDYQFLRKQVANFMNCVSSCIDPDTHSSESC